MTDSHTPESVEGTNPAQSTVAVKTSFHWLDIHDVAEGKPPFRIGLAERFPLDMGDEITYRYERSDKMGAPFIPEITIVATNRSIGQVREVTYNAVTGSKVRATFSDVLPDYSTMNYDLGWRDGCQRARAELGAKRPTQNERSLAGSCAEGQDLSHKAAWDGLCHTHLLEEFAVTAAMEGFDLGGVNMTNPLTAIGFDAILRRLNYVDRNPAGGVVIGGAREIKVHMTTSADLEDRAESYNDGYEVGKLDGNLTAFEEMDAWLGERIISLGKELREAAGDDEPGEPDPGPDAREHNFFAEGVISDPPPDWLTGWRDALAGVIAKIRAEDEKKAATEKWMREQEERKRVEEEHLSGLGDIHVAPMRDVYGNAVAEDQEEAVDLRLLRMNTAAAVVSIAISMASMVGMTEDEIMKVVENAPALELPPLDD